MVGASRVYCGRGTVGMLWCCSTVGSTPTTLVLFDQSVSITESEKKNTSIAIKFVFFMG